MDASESPARHFIAFISSRASVMSRERVPFAPPAFVADGLKKRTWVRELFVTAYDACTVGASQLACINVR